MKLTNKELNVVYMALLVLAENAMADDDDYKLLNSIVAYAEKNGIHLKELN
jgi:hypothetical protein